MNTLQDAIRHRFVVGRNEISAKDVVSSGIEEDDEPMIERISDPSPTPERVLENKELGAILYRAALAANLTPNEWRVQNWRHVDEYSTKETATLRGKTQGTVKTELSRADRKLRQAFLSLAGDYFEKP